MIIEKTQSCSKLAFCPLPSDDPTQRRPDIALAGRMLDWQPHIALSEGLDRTIDYYAQLLEAKRP